MDDSRLEDLLVEVSMLHIFDIFDLLQDSHEDI